MDLEFQGDSLGNGICDYISQEFNAERCRYLPELWVTQDKSATISDCVNQRLSASQGGYLQAAVETVGEKMFHI